MSEAIRILPAIEQRARALISCCRRFMTHCANLLARRLAPERPGQALNGMAPDREVLIPRHFEELSNAKAARVLVFHRQQCCPSDLVKRGAKIPPRGPSRRARSSPG
jgi:hypothetical protein